MDPFALMRWTLGVLLWVCALRLQQALELMARGLSFTQAFAVETFGPVLLVLTLLWRTGVLFRPWTDPLAGIAVTVGVGLLGILATKPAL